jgi:hypothetical protein
VVLKVKARGQRDLVAVVGQGAPDPETGEIILAS